jgi:hypothetical protein
VGLRAIALALPVLVLAGCSRGCSRERPYTPYAIDGAPPASGHVALPADASVTSIGLGGDAGSFVHVVGLRPDPTGGFRIDGATSIAPLSGESFILYLVADLDADGTRDAVAFTSASDPLAGRLLFYKGVAGGAAPAAPKQLAVLAPGAIGAPGCPAEAALEQIGPATVAVSLRAICGAAAPGKKHRWIAVAMPSRDPALRQELWLGDPAVGERLGVELDGSDLDGDQRDDLVVRVSVEGAPAPFEQAPRVSADLRWLDRQTGLSRDPDEPEGSLRRAATAELARAAKKAEAAQVKAGVRQIVRLYGWLCSDAGEPLVVVSAGGIRCGPSRALEDAASASVRAALTLGDVPRAVAAYEHMGWYPATTTKQRRAELEKALLKAAPTRVPSVTKVFATVPDFDASGAPGWGSLTFTPGGDLLVRTKNGLAMVNVQTGVEGAAQGIPSWPADVTNLDGSTRWTGLFDPCDGIALRVRFGTSDAPVPVVPPLPSRCAAGAPTVRLEGVPVAWGAVGLEGWMGGEPILVSSDMTQVKPLSEVGALGQPVHAGSPRAPDGRSIVVGTKLGALVRVAKAWQLWRPADLEGAYAYADLRSCTISNDARMVACVRDGRLVGMIAP